ncbi:MAG: CdvA-like protein [Candidatus Bathyarchaeia archaeon]|nr:CdvA-like protein [Candidatus Bathyarchaeota archaeon]
MSSSLPEYALKTFLGKRVRDPYGRSLGAIIGLSLNDYGEIEAVNIDKGNNEIQRVPIEQLTLSDDGVVVIPKWKVEVETILKQIQSAQKRIGSLKLLMQREPSKNLFDELLIKQERELADLREKRNVVISILQARCRELDMQIDELSKILVEIKAGKWSKEFMNKAYEITSKSIEPNLEFASREKRDLTGYLSNLARAL